MALVIRHGDEENETEYVSFSGHTLAKHEMVPDECIIVLEDEAAIDLAQQLWDAGHHPREALNHQETIHTQRTEIKFLRTIVQQLIGQVSKVVSELRPFRKTDNSL